MLATSDKTLPNFGRNVLVGNFQSSLTNCQKCWQEVVFCWWWWFGAVQKCANIVILRECFYYRKMLCSTEKYNFPMNVKGKTQNSAKALPFWVAVHGTHERFSNLR